MNQFKEQQFFQNIHQRNKSEALLHLHEAKHIVSNVFLCHVWMEQASGEPSPPRLVHPQDVGFGGPAEGVGGGTVAIRIGAARPVFGEKSQL